MEMISLSGFAAEHPLDTVERLAIGQDWSYDRDGKDEIEITVEGAKSDYAVTFTWLGDLEAVHFACSFPLHVPEARLKYIMQLVRKLNESLWIGHFDYWPKENIVVFRHAMLLPGGTAPSTSQCTVLLQHGTEACERYFDAFELTNWGGQMPEAALISALFQTAGTA
jgi:hypothetical protein